MDGRHNQESLNDKLARVWRLAQKKYNSSNAIGKAYMADRFPDDDPPRKMNAKTAKSLWTAHNEKVDNVAKGSSFVTKKKQKLKE